MIYMFNLEEYTTVAERIKSFRQMFPMGRILTYLIHEDANRVVFKAELYRDDQDEYPFSTGYAREITAERGVNRDFALENCETSSIGIAAKNADIGTEKKSISREEAAKVNRVQQKDAVIKETKAKMAETSQQYVPVAKADDPWTTWEAPAPQTMESAVEMVKTLLGGTMPDESCIHGARIWKTGVSKAGNKPWGHWRCPNQATSGSAAGADDKCEPIWYEVKPDGTWGKRADRG
jgi:hypothetical protein